MSESPQETPLQSPLGECPHWGHQAKISAGRKG
jgi:hypothetical protein